MDFKCGVDIIEIERIKSSIDEIGDDFLNKVYTQKEIQYCESKKIQKYQSYAARFAAKEAVFKAISSKIKNKYDISWKDIEILNDENGRPQIYLYCKDIEEINTIDVSMSHCKEYAVANVIVSYK